MNFLDQLKQWFQPAPVTSKLSKRALRRIEHTTCRRFRETHQDGREHTVTRCRLNMAYLDRSKYSP